MPISIAIDGPASSGKGTVARGVARALHYHYVDTGAMYRAVALVALRRGVPWEDSEELGALASGLHFRFEWDDDDVLHVIVDGEDVTRAIREDALGTGASTVSRHPEVREALLGLQRALGKQGAVVMDGRDIGTVVLPGAELKVYLDADLDERARRRHDELLRRGESYTFDDVRSALRARDRQDSERAAAPLRVAEDAVVVDTTELSIPQAIRKVLELAHERGA
jgi:cytidylate kinase